MSRIAPAFVVALVVMAFGVYLRLLGMFEIEIWADEARWAIKLLDGTHGAFRPIGYMWLTGQIVDLHHNEVTLRSLSYLGGVLFLPASYLVFRRLVSSPWIVSFGLFLLAVNPVAVGMTKEFKPYALECAVHVLLIALVLAYRERPTSKLLAAFLLSAVLAPLFAWTVIFLYPAAFVGVAHQTLQTDRRWRRNPHLYATVLGALLTLALLITIYALQVSGEGRRRAGTWGKKYDVFFIEEGVLDRVGWFFEKTADIAGFPARIDLPVSEAAVWLCALGCALGALLLMAQRRWMHVALVASPWAVAIVFNIAKLWPYGAFRTNLFLLFYAVALIVCALDISRSLLTKRWPTLRAPLALSLVVVTVLAFPNDIEAYRGKGRLSLTQDPKVRTAMEHIYLAEMEKATIASPTSTRQGKDTLLLNGHSCESFNYYLKYHPETSARYREWFGEHFKVRCTQYNKRHYRKILKQYRDRSFWLITAGWNLKKLTLDTLRGHCDIRQEEQLNEATLLVRCE